MRIEIVTLFPGMVEAYLEGGVVGRAVGRGALEVGTEDPRRHASDVHRTVDDRPYGGGPGMVMAPVPLAAAIRSARTRVAAGSAVLALGPAGRRFDQGEAERMASLPGLVLVAGRYEGIDERVLEALVDEELSLGDYVLSGGELAALAAEAVAGQDLAEATGPGQVAGPEPGGAATAAGILCRGGNRPARRLKATRITGVIP